MSLLTQTPSPSPPLVGAAKLEDVSKLMKKLSLDLTKPNLSPTQRDTILEKVKVYGRDPLNADPIFTKEGIETLCRHGFDGSSQSASHNALRCLANAMLLREETRQMFLDLKYEPKACQKLQNDDRDDEFLCSRIIFLTTYNPNLKIDTLVTEHQLASTLSANLARHAQQNTSTKKIAARTPMEEMALVESLKLLFNLTHFCPTQSAAFSSAIPSILELLAKVPLNTNKPLETPVGTLINSLLNLPTTEPEHVEAFFPQTLPSQHVTRLLEILDLSAAAYSDSDMEEFAAPLIILLRNIYGIALPEVKTLMQNRLLPSDADRKETLGKAKTLSGRLLKLSTCPTAPKLREAIQNLLFDLSDHDATKFVQNIGYGFASGFLFSHNVPIPESAVDAWSTGKSTPGLNPITGQKLDAEPAIEEPEMTQEEKEREAERLFVLFERLKKTGVMNVQNPMEKALHEGRFEELSDDEGAESD